MCPRCGNTLLTYRRYEVQATLALAASALIFLVLSLPFNFLSFRASGQQHNIDLPAGIAVLIDHDYFSLALVTGLATVVLPGMVLTGIMLLASARLNNWRASYLRHLYKWVNALLPWSMAEVFMVGTLVSLIKITSLAEVSIGISFYSFLAFTALMTLTLVYFDHTRTALWLYAGNVPEHQPLTEQRASFCIQRTWALLITAFLLYIPANTLPIMNMTLFGRSEPNTIMGGVIALWQSKSYPVAIIIFIASIVVPIVKIAILGWLNYTVHNDQVNNSAKKMRMYRFIEWIGRWSMIDVFVVAVLVALIQLGSALSVLPGPAALAFCGVVFITMVAAMTFDTRLIWRNRKYSDE